MFKDNQIVTFLSQQKMEKLFFLFKSFCGKKKSKTKIYFDIKNPACFFEKINIIFFKT